MRFDAEFDVDDTVKTKGLEFEKGSDLLESKPIC